ncbi:hypothetical protein [Dyella acidiphila]|uniref:Uncharacterized protein n=1 Tax=Dyella acidiphila TaxID=2775866 RepID=A0ABR9G4K7_9GAMM|nr:hypothetical protein [Dyella acidiphila]MBE1158984.1 hypothetical protein [Dyella acidiphila]
MERAVEARKAFQKQHPPASPKQVSAPPPPSGLTLEKAIQNYAEVEAPGLKGDTWDGRQRALKTFVGKLGAQTPVASIINFAQMKLRLFSARIVRLPCCERFYQRVLWGNGEQTRTMAKLSLALRAFRQSIAHWGVVEYALLLLLWGGVSAPFYSWGWGAFSVLSLPLILAMGMIVLYFAERIFRRHLNPAQERRMPPLNGRFHAATSLEAESYFKEVSTGAYSEMFEIEVNLLKREDAEAFTDQIFDHPLIQFFNGLVLDDPNTSDHHILLRWHPFEGCVLFLPHDDDSRVVFRSLGDFLDGVRRCKESGQPLREMHPELSPVPSDQVALSRVIRDLIEGADDDISIALALIPSMDLSDVTLLERMAVDQNFYLGEAVANEIAKRPSVDLKPIALLCSKHSHIQVANAGAEALNAF